MKQPHAPNSVLLYSALAKQLLPAISQITLRLVRTPLFLHTLSQKSAASSAEYVLYYSCHQDMLRVTNTASKLCSKLAPDLC